MNEKIENKFREITYDSVANLFASLKDKLNDVYPSEKYHDEWVLALFDGVVDTINILLGELFVGKEEEVKEMFEELKTQYSSKYSNPKSAILMSLLTVLAVYDNDNVNILELKLPDTKKDSFADIAYM